MILPKIENTSQPCLTPSPYRTSTSENAVHTGIQAGGSLILSTHLENGMTADNTGEPVFWWLNIYLREESQRAEEFEIFIVKIGYS